MTSPGSQNIAVASSMPNCEPAVMRMSSGSGDSLDFCIKSASCSRSGSIPEPAPYCSASRPCSLIRRFAACPSSLSGSAVRSGLPPANEIIPGSIETSHTDRTGEGRKSARAGRSFRRERVKSWRGVLSSRLGPSHPWCQGARVRAWEPAETSGSWCATRPGSVIFGPRFAGVGDRRVKSYLVSEEVKKKFRANRFGPIV